MARGGTEVVRYAGRARRWARRGLLVGLAGAAVAGVVACGPSAAPAKPDPLQPLLNAAVADADLAKAAAKQFSNDADTLTVLGSLRQAQADALRTEINRAAALTSAPSSAGQTSAAQPPTDEAAVLSQLRTSLQNTQQQIATLLPQLPAYRAGLVGSIAAGCASLTEALNGTAIPAITPLSAPSTPADPTNTTQSSGTQSGGGLSGDTVTALQQALGAEHAAYWLYGTVSAYTGSATTEVVTAMGVVQNLRDATERRLTAAGATANPAAPAYAPPQPVTSQATGLAALAVAESDATVAWRAVLDRTEDPQVRTMAEAALIDSAVRETRWRRLSGQSPASIPLPGLPTAS